MPLPDNLRAKVQEAAERRFNLLDEFTSAYAQDHFMSGADYLYSIQEQTGVRSAKEIVQDWLNKERFVVSFGGEIVTGNIDGLNANDLVRLVDFIRLPESSPLPEQTGEQEVWNEFYNELDDLARERDSYDFGLPMTNTGEIISKLQSRYNLTKKP